MFAYLRSISKPASEPEKSIENIHKEVEALSGEDAQLQPHLGVLSFGAHKVESDSIFGKSILGNTDSEVANLIDKLGNSDWVKQGLSYLPEDVGEPSAECPFCQQRHHIREVH